MPLPAIAAWIAANPGTAAKIGFSAFSAIRGLGRQGGLPKRKKSKYETRYVAELERRMKEGVYSPAAMQNMTNKVTRRASEIGNRQKASIRGDITRQGLENSSVMQYATRPVDRNVLQNVTESVRDITTANELSKTGAADKLGQYGMQESDAKNRYAMMRYQTRQQGTSDALGWLGSAVETYLGKGSDPILESILSGKTKSNTEIYKWIYSQQNPEQARELLWDSGINF